MTQNQISSIRSQFLGPVVAPGDADYDTVRRIYNASVDRRPAVIVRCAGAADVIRAVNVAQENGLPISVRGGGHNVAGRSICDDGLMIDLSRMRAVRVDPEQRRVRADPGTTYREFDHETQSFGLATTGGAVSSTGIAGLTLGGGLGWLARKHGLACDNLVSADVVTADQRLLHASKDENPDLFWGLRGGGGNFGVVTSFEYRLHEVGPILAGMLVHPASRARELLRARREPLAQAPDELIAFCGLLYGPDGTPIAADIPAYIGPLQDGERALQPFRTFGPPLADMVAPMPYVKIQQMFDEGMPAGLHIYWTSAFLKSVSDEVIDIIADAFERMPTRLCVLLLEQIGGAVRRVAADETPVTLRDGEFNLAIIGRWMDPADRDKTIAWAKQLARQLAPHSLDSVYVNYLPDDESGRVATAYGSARYRKLVDLKRKYDPENVFRMNANIDPKG
jgi:FAD/FMN-containing dehydrogenase